VLFNANDEAQTVSVPARTTAVFMEQNVFTYYLPVVDGSRR